MTRRPPRTFAALTVLWFAMLMAGPMLHQCAMHDGAAMGASTSMPTHATHDGDHESAPADDDCDQCTCLGDCVGTAVAFASANPERPLRVGVERSSIAPAGALSPSAGSPDVRLPFSVGPPLLA